ncbi:MAG: hypothetical protein AAF419_01650 [Pseudomonadota bacterium]
MNSIITLRDQINRHLQDGNLNQLQSDVPAYNKAVKGFFSELHTEQVHQQQLTDLKELLAKHQKLVKSIQNKNQQIKDEIKKIKRGKNMQKTYPQL